MRMTIWSNFNSLRPKMLCAKFEIGPFLFKKYILKVCQCIFAILLLSPIRKGRDPSFEQNLNPHHRRIYFVPSLVKSDPMVLEKMNMWKFYSQTDRLTDDERQVIRKTRHNSQLRSAKEITSVICNLRYVSVSLQFIRNVLIRLYLFLFTRTICNTVSRNTYKW